MGVAYVSVQWNRQKKLYDTVLVGGVALYLVIFSVLTKVMFPRVTDEIMLIGHQMSPWHSIALVMVSLLVMHAFVYSVEFLGSAPIPEGASRRGIFVRYFDTPMLRNCLRISAGLEEHNEPLVRALREIGAELGR